MFANKYPLRSRSVTNPFPPRTSLPHRSPHASHPQRGKVRILLLLDHIYDPTPTYLRRSEQPPVMFYILPRHRLPFSCRVRLENNDGPLPGHRQLPGCYPDNTSRRRVTTRRRVYRHGSTGGHPTAAYRTGERASLTRPHPHNTCVHRHQRERETI